jgi:hypothetical protein
MRCDACRASGATVVDEEPDEAVLSDADDLDQLAGTSSLCLAFESLAHSPPPPPPPPSSSSSSLRCIAATAAANANDAAFAAADAMRFATFASAFPGVVAHSSSVVWPMTMCQ